MELVYYRLIFENQREYLVETDSQSLEDFTGKIFKMFGKSEYIKLQLTPESDPIAIRTASLFSIQQARELGIGTQTKKWRLL